MLARTQYFVFLIFLGATLTGCQAMRSSGKKVGGAVVGATCYLGGALLNGLLEPNETILEKEARQKNERAWKQHWRDHPDEIPAMTERYKNDYE
jgi:hypothetical protein